MYAIRAGCGRIASVCLYAIRAYVDEQPMFACTLSVRKLTNSPCLRVRYSFGYGLIARVSVYANHAYADE